MTNPELAAAVQQLYVVFGKYPRPTKIECCPCGCTKPNATAHLLSVPLSALRFEDMLDFCFRALTTQGSVDDFRYLFPRLMQGIVQEPCGCNPETLFGKLRYAKWLTWPPDEIEAIQRFIRALWIAALGTFPVEVQLPAFSEIETVLASIAATGDDLEPFLAAWTVNKTEEADRNLVQFVTMYGSEFIDGCTFSDGYWTDLQAQALALRHWILLPNTLQRVARATRLLPADGFEPLFQTNVEGLLKEARA